ncbi:hypothetical protein, partial [Mariniphaga sediminis]|uniref:hypothetical protein n=1 Tax=Mariniphaga sediminis TaxID=1628158 RepID=UPI003561AC8F
PVIQIHTNNDYREMLKHNNIWIYTTKAGYDGIIKNIGSADTVIYIRQRGMNSITLDFLSPKTREESLQTNYLIKKNNLQK